MMMGIIIKDLSNKLGKHIDEKNGEIFVDAKWVNDWLEKNGASFIAKIVDENGKEISGSKVSITKK
jgi:hypothetical protein